MAIKRCKCYAHGYTIVNNDIITNKELSGTARFILIYMLHCKDDWKFSIQSIVDNTGIKITRVKTALQELKSKGYIAKTAIKDRKGKFVCHNWDISNQPIFEPNEQSKRLSERYEIDESLLPFA